MAMCMKLAFWTGRDKEQMDRLFRQSGLIREKWEQCWWDDPEQEERCLDFCCMGDEHGLLIPSGYLKPTWVAGAISGNNVGKMSGSQYMEPLRLHPDFPALLARLEKLAVRRKTEENGGQ